MRNSFLLAAVAAICSNRVFAEEYPSAVTATVTRTHFTCPCDGKTWEFISSTSMKWSSNGWAPWKSTTSSSATSTKISSISDKSWSDSASWTSTLFTTRPYYLNSTSLSSTTWTSLLTSTTDLPVLTSHTPSTTISSTTTTTTVTPDITTTTTTSDVTTITTTTVLSTTTPVTTTTTTEPVVATPTTTSLNCDPTTTVSTIYILSKRNAATATGVGKALKPRGTAVVSSVTLTIYPDGCSATSTSATTTTTSAATTTPPSTTVLSTTTTESLSTTTATTTSLNCDPTTTVSLIYYLGKREGATMAHERRGEGLASSVTLTIYPSGCSATTTSVATTSSSTTTTTTTTTTTPPVTSTAATTTSTTTTTTTTSTPTPTFNIKITSGPVSNQYAYLAPNGPRYVVQFTSDINAAASFVLDPTTSLLKTADGLLQAYGDFEEVNVGLQYFGTPAFIETLWQDDYVNDDSSDYFTNPNAPYPPQSCTMSTDGLYGITCAQTNYIEGFTVILNLFQYCTGDGTFAFNAIDNCSPSTLTAVNISY